MKEKLWQIGRLLRFRLLIAVFGAAALMPGPAVAAGELTLEELVQRARQNDLRVQEAQAELENLRAKYREAYWAWFPKFETTLAFGGPTPEARNNGLGGPPTTAATLMYDLNFGRTGYMVRGETSALVPVYTFGKLAALRRVGEQGLVIGEGLKTRAREEAGFQTAQAFYGYQLARQGRGALQETLARLNEAERLIKNLIAQESSQVGQIDLYKLDFFRRQIEARFSQADAGMTFASAALRLLTNARGDAAPNIIAQDLAPPQFSVCSVDQCLALARENRPELKIAQAGLVARDNEVLIRRRMYLPDLGIGGFFRFAYTSSATRQRSPFAYDPFNDLSGGVALVARATFDLPVKGAQLDQAMAERDKLATQRELLQAAIRLEIQKLHSELRDAQERAKAFEDAEASARRWSTAAFANFELGTTDTRELIDGFSALAQASAEKLKSWHDARVALWNLARATGTTVQSVAQALQPPKSE